MRILRERVVALWGESFFNQAESIANQSMNSANPPEVTIAAISILHRNQNRITALCVIGLGILLMILACVVFRGK